VALVASSELFLRMVLLAGLSRDRPVARLPFCLSSCLSSCLSLGPRDAARSRLHVLDPGLRHRHPAAGGADAALPRRALSRVSVAYQQVFSAATGQSMIRRSGYRSS